MASDPYAKELWRLASELQQTPLVLTKNVELATARDARHRSVVSRAYYAGFLALRSFFEARGSIFTVPNEHEQVLGAARDHDDPDLKMLGLLLKNCRDQRTTADYRLNQRLTDRDASSVLDDTKEILDKLDSL